MQLFEECGNCHRSRYDHDEIGGELVCKEPLVHHGYGFFHGGDPRDFHPDVECCSEEEIENHRKACELWNTAESNGQTPNPEECPSGWVYDDDGNATCHVLLSPYGIGSYTIQMKSVFEPMDDVDPWDES